MSNWYVTTKRADFQAIAEQFGISPILARLIRNRDVCGEQAIREYLYGTSADFADPYLLPDMDRAVSVIRKAIAEKQKIRVIGDYDADGVCSAYVLSYGLRSLGADADTAIPHRVLDGYGLNERLIDEAAEQGINLILTCDNGISAAQQIHQAHALGMQVVVTDHHEVPFQEKDGVRTELLPEADAVVDPKRDGCRYPFTGICGAFLAWKLLQALGCSAEILGELMEPAAFATICDVMELQGENRILVKEGLGHMRHTQNEGLKALMDVCMIRPEALEVYHVGFVLGPCINATGRLESALMALRLWEAPSREEAVRIATELKNLNDSRKEMTQSGVEAAVEQLDAQEKLDRVLVLFLPDCHESIAGIIAGRIRERYERPVFVLTRAEDGVKGSGRSIESYDMYAAISACSKLFTKFGGHKMAAGVSLPEENVEAFRQFLNEHCTLTESDFVRKVHIDIPLPISRVTPALLQEIRLLEPFGNGNAKPVFAQKNVQIRQARVVGKNENVCRLQILDDAGNPAEMVYFGDIPAFRAFLEKQFGKAGKDVFFFAVPGLTISVVYYPNEQEYRGRKSIQIVMTDYCAV